MNAAPSDTMKAVVWARYGAPADVLEVRDIPKPNCEADSVLVRVRAAGANPYDWHFYRGDPMLIRPSVGFRKPRQVSQLGADFAGVVEEVGAHVTDVKVGDRVYGQTSLGAFAEYVAVTADHVTRAPTNMTFEEAASVPMGATTAMTAVAAGRFTPGQSVIVNGASGGIGIFAVQLAKAMGASEVTGVCSTRNVAKVKSLGADTVIDYTVDDYSKADKRYDLFVDTQYSQAVRRSLRAIKRTGTFAFAGGGGGRLMGPGGPMLRSLIAGLFVPQRTVAVIAKTNMGQLAQVTELIEAGKVRALIDSTFPLAEIVSAMTRLETGHASGKVIVTF